MFEKVLKRLCPCYFARDDDSSGCANKSSDDRLPSSDRGYSDSNVISESTSTNTRETWKGTLNLVQPQPVYAFPSVYQDSRRKGSTKPKSRSLRLGRPPSLDNHPHKTHSSYFLKKRSSKSTVLKHSETVADITSLTGPSMMEVRWLKSQSLDSFSFGASGGTRKSSRVGSHAAKDHPMHHNFKKGSGDWNCLRCQVFPDLSHGVVVFTAAYFSKKKLCMIHVDRLENLSKKGREGNSFYSVVKIAILPSEKYIKCSKILTNCSSPDVKQDFSFSVKELGGRTLRLSVFDVSLQKQHEAVGHALLTLEDIICDQPKKYRINLYRRTQPHVCPGNLALSLKYFADDDKFTITVDKGRNLSLQRDKNVKLNTYVKVSLYAYGEKVKTKKSLVVSDSRDPNYNSTFTFQVRKDQIDHLSVTISVRLKGFVNDMTIGRLNFGPFFFVEDSKLTPWGRVFLKREWVSHWFRMYL